MVQEKERMEPLLGGGAALFVDEFVFRHENAGKDRQADIALESPRRVGDEEDKCKARQDGQRVKGMSDPLPFGQAAANMEVEFIKENDESLDGEREQK